MTEYDPEPVESLLAPPQVGRVYLVRCLLVNQEGAELLLPVIGPRHADPEHGINAPYYHWHIDVRFLTEAALRVALSRIVTERMGSRQGAAAMFAPEENLAKFATSNLVLPDPVGLPLVHRPLSCRRALDEGRLPPWQAALEAAYAGATLLPGGLCPHRRFPMLAEPLRGGRLLCAGHGLCFTKEGRQCPRSGS